MDKRPIIIDTDPGVNGTPAIAIALFSDELDVRLISTVAGSVGLDKVTYNALRLLKYFGRKDVLAAVGANRPLIRESEDTNSVHGESSMEGFDFEGPTQQPLKESIVDAMRNVIVNSSEPVTPVPIASLTNTALLLETYPEVKRNIRGIVLTGGNASRGNKGIVAKFNIALNPEAAYMVLHSGAKLTMVGLNVGLRASVSPEDSEEIRTINKTGEMAYCSFKKCRGGGFRTRLKIYDVTVVAYLLRPELFEVVETYLDVGLYGTMTIDCTLVDLKDYLGKESNVTVCLDIGENAFRMWSKGTIAKRR